MASFSLSLTLVCKFLDDRGEESLPGEKGEACFTIVAVAIGGPMAETGDALSLMKEEESHGEAPRWPAPPPLLAAVMAALARGELSLSLIGDRTGPEMLRRGASLMAPPDPATDTFLSCPPPFWCLCNGVC